MTKDEFISRVMELVETDRLGELDKLYDEIMGLGVNYPEITTRGGGVTTVTWDKL